MKTTALSIRKPHFIVNVFHTRDPCWRGVIKNFTTGEQHNFRNLLEFILFLKDWMDTNQSPPPPGYLRSWQNREDSLEEQTSRLLDFMQPLKVKWKQEEQTANKKLNRTQEQKNKTGSTDFLIRIQFRQHTSWQGEIQWLNSEEEQTVFFRSLLEMILLMDEALTR